MVTLRQPLKNKNLISLNCEKLPKIYEPVQPHLENSTFLYAPPPQKSCLRLLIEADKIEEVLKFLNDNWTGK